MPAVGELFGGSFLQVAFDRLATPEFMNFVRRWKIDLDEVESLKQTSAMIQALSDEAEVKQFNNEGVKLWLNRIRQLLYDVEDILDEFATELLRLKLESAHQTQQVRNPVPLTVNESSVSSSLKSCSESTYKCINETLERVKYIGPEELEAIKKFGNNVKHINERLKSVAEEGCALGLNSNMASGSSRTRVFSQRPPTSSVVNKSKIFGREEDMWKIVRWLLSPIPCNNHNNFSVLPIVGMGGVGKTTLAQLVYNDEGVEKHFGLKAWVCVSEDFDVVRLTKEILESVTRSCEPSNSLELLKMKLKEELCKKRFLLVLDDMWNENYERWDDLSTTFAFGKPGSKILVTTRNKSVSSMVRTVPNDHDLKGLSDKDCLTLFRRHALVDSSDLEELIEVFGQEIVKKCEGLPLVVKTLAGLLRHKRSIGEWKTILENEIWDLRGSEILPSLMLSYHHLSPLLKRCFAYCALFPKDYVFSKIELVVLWMAEGIVQPRGDKRLEIIGAGYFDELFMRSFFELSNRRPSNEAYAYVSPLVPPHYQTFYDLSKKLDIRSFFDSSNKSSATSNKLESSSNMGSGFEMHVLIHGLAKFVSVGVHCKREYGKPSNILSGTCHLSYHLKNGNIEATESENLRTFLIQFQCVISCNRVQFLPTMQFQFLRVLLLTNCRNRELPDSIGKLKHLRLIDLSFTDIERLPNSIGRLYNLQTLVLTGCFRLTELPEDMDKLVNLRHIILPGPLDSCEMPLGVGNLMS